MELRLIELIRQFSERASGRIGASGGLIKAIGDDAAVLRPLPGRDMVVTTDTFCEGVHFDLAYFSPYTLGKRLAAANLSDIAAMGAVPAYGFLNLEVPEEFSSERDLEGFWRPLIYGLTCRLAQYGALLSGGDTVSTTGGLGLSLTLIGWVEGGRALMRSGARPGDLLYCSGPLGEADAGLDILKGNIAFRASRRRPSRRAIRYLISRHLLPEPRVGLGRALLEAGVTACIDISDGVATDAAHLAQESGCRIVIDESRLPVSRAMRLLAMQQGRGVSQRRWLRRKLLSGGEDFELLWTVPPEGAEGMERTAMASCGMRPVRIGRVEQGRGVFLKTLSGTLEEISFKGYEHLFLS